MADGSTRVSNTRASKDAVALRPSQHGIPYYEPISMNQLSIFLPVAALAFLTLLVLALVPVRRFIAGFSGQVRMDDFRFGESANVPSPVSIPNRAYMNLLESPVLFHVACLAYYVTENVTERVLMLAWSYVGLRIVHSLVLLTYNKVLHRLTLFALSTIVLVMLWTNFARAIWSGLL